MEELDPVWRKASYSGNGGNCVEVGGVRGGVVVRDTKNRDGLALSLRADAWNRLISEVKAGKLGLRLPRIPSGGLHR